MNRLLTAILLAAPLIFTVAASKTTTPPDLLVNISCDKPVYQTKEPVTMTLTVINTSSTVQEFVFNSGKKYDFYLYRGRKLVWKWSQGKMFSQAISGLSLNPSQTLEYPGVFDQTLPSGKSIRPGRYQLKGAFCTGGQEYLSNPITIEIRR
jgi:hypothetical protein